MNTGMNRVFLAGLAAAFPLTVLACGPDKPLAPELDARSANGSGPSVTAPSSVNATAVSFSQINVGWQDKSSNESGFEVHRSTTGLNGVFTLLASMGANVTSYSNGGLSGSTQYCYKVRAFRTTGGKTTFSAFSSAACATTPAPPVPPAPSAVNAAPVQGRWIRITWTDNSSNESGFRVERAASGAGPWTPVAALSANTTTVNDFQFPGVEQAVCYRVFAFNSFGDSGPSNMDCTAVPATPTNLTGVPVGTTAVDLTWTDNSAVEDGYQVQRAGGGVGLTIVATLPANTTSFHDAGLTPDSTYFYEVHATKDGGTSDGWSTSVVLAATPPAAPGSLGVQPLTSSGVYGLWLDQSTNEQGFRVERSIDGGASWVTAATTDLNEVTFTEQGLAAEQRVCYRVFAFNSVGDSPPSNTACTTPPAAPTDLSVTAVDAASVDLTWTDNSAVEDGYEVWVDDGYGSQYAIASLGPNTTAFQTSYYYAYWVLAVKDGGSSDASNVVYAPPPPGTSSLRAAPTSRVTPRRPPVQRGRP